MYPTYGIPKYLRRKRTAEKKADYRLAYIVLALGALTIVLHYTVVLPYLASLGL